MKKFFAAPVFSNDEKKTRSAGFINIIVLTNIPILLLFIVARISTGAKPFGVANLILMTIITILTVVWFLMKAGKVRLAGYLHLITIWIASTMIALDGSGVRGTAFTSYFVVMLMAGLLLGWRLAVGFAILSIFAGFGLAQAENMGIVIYSQGPAISTAIEGTVLIIFGGIFLYLIINSLESALATAKLNAIELQKRNDELQNVSENLEQRIYDRTDELTSANRFAQKRANQFQAVTEVSRAINARENLISLLPQITNVISEKFDFYHVGIFLIDSAHEYAVLSASNSSGGQKMIARRHQLKIGEQGIVGNVTQSGKPRIALDVGADASYFTNAELPLTHSEMALPLKIEGQVIGALDIQSEVINAFSEEDIEGLETLADQVSLAIENARLFDKTEKSLAEAEAIQRQYLRETWDRLPKEENFAGFRYSAIGTTQININEKVEIPGNKTYNEVTMPITIRGETIGSLSIQMPQHERVTSDQMDLIRAVAERVALSAENARLFEETARRASRESLVSDITTKIRSTNNPQEMLKTAVEELQRALGATRVEIVPRKNAPSPDK